MSANTHAFARIHDVSDVSNKKIDISKYKLTKIDFEKALMEVKPQFGVSVFQNKAKAK